MRRKRREVVEVGKPSKVLHCEKISVRARPVIADGHPRHAFLDISIRLRGGRPPEDKQRATAHVFATAERYCAAVMDSSSFMLSLEMRDIDPELSPKASSIRKYVSGDAS